MGFPLVDDDTCFGPAAFPTAAWRHGNGSAEVHLVGGQLVGPGARSRAVPGKMWRGRGGLGPGMSQ